MLTIGIIGANGQVGAEVCLYLNRMEGIKVIPICRTELGAASLKRWRLESRCGVLDTPERAKELLSGCDLVVDFSLPRGEQSEIRAVAKRTLTHAIAQAPENARFVYISTLMALGMKVEGGRLKRHFLAQTTYGSFKRYAERKARRLGRAAGREVTVLRLGEVHGERQRVSNALISKLKDRTAYVPENVSYTVFVFTIAEALVNIAKGKERPGIYSLVSHPEWTWSEVYRHHLRQSGLATEVRSLPCEHSQHTNAIRSAFASLARSIASSLVAALLRHRDLFAGYVLPWTPQLAMRFRAEFHTRRARDEIAELHEADLYRPYSEPFLGAAPGQRLVSLSDCRSSMHDLARQVREDSKQIMVSPG